MTLKIHYSFIPQTNDDGQVAGSTALFYVSGTLGLLGAGADSQACGLVLAPIAITDGPRLNDTRLDFCGSLLC